VKKRLSLNTKLKAYSGIVLIPAALICTGMLIMVFNYGQRYDAIVKNITAANQYSLAFKEDIDYAMYRIVIGAPENVEKLDDNPDFKNPYKVIEDSREAFLALQKVSNSSDSRQLDRLMQNLSTLEERIDEIIDNVKEGGHYDDNIYNLESNIYILTELGQENIQAYIYHQANTMETLRQDIEGQFQVTLLLSLALFILLWIGMWIATKRISDSIAIPIGELCKTTELVAEGDFSTRAADTTGDEVVQLTESFNRMVGKIGKLVDDVKTEQLKLRDAELKVLQAQINPHFLYNTLDTIVWLAEDGKNDEVVKMVSALSDFFRGVLRKGRDTVSLAEEKQLIISYLDIQKYRYSDILSYEIDIPEEFYPYQILKLTLQPLVENALYHGIKYKRSMGKILVSAKRSHDTLILNVSDDGVGMTDDQLNDLRESMSSAYPHTDQSGFGISNVAERIRLYYGLDYGLEVESNKGEGTTFTVRLPLIKNENESFENENTQ
jgi:two-component system sensor histidine kinase YesM